MVRQQPSVAKGPVQIACGVIQWQAYVALHIRLLKVNVEPVIAHGLSGSEFAPTTSRVCVLHGHERNLTRSRRRPGMM